MLLKLRLGTAKLIVGLEIGRTKIELKRIGLSWWWEYTGGALGSHLQ